MDDLCELCEKRKAIKTNGYGENVCRRCASHSTKPIVGHTVETGRNASCPCGSGKKFKSCCRPALV